MQADDLEWEEWDHSSPFWHHCIAGSTAGVAEHTLLYPVDTVKTHLQCVACPHRAAASSSSIASRNSTTTAAALSSQTPRFLLHNTSSTLSTMRHLMSQAATLEAATASNTTTTTATAGASRLWRGVQAMAVGCIPAHALYFSSYEIVLAHTSDRLGTQRSGMAAGAVATIGHDIIMTPMDTIKQRLQLGHYRGMMHALTHIGQTEGMAGLYRSFGITLTTNVPYGMVMVSTNEVLKERLGFQEQPTLAKLLLSSSVAGCVAAATTTPLDRIKTFLQTQQLQPACDIGQCPELRGKPLLSVSQVVRVIAQKEGVAGFFKGLGPRVLTHTPAVAISWTTYETVKQWLASSTM